MYGRNYPTGNISSKVDRRFSEDDKDTLDSVVRSIQNLHQQFKEHDMKMDESRVEFENYRNTVAGVLKVMNKSIQIFREDEIKVGKTVCKVNNLKDDIEKINSQTIEYNTLFSEKLVKLELNVSDTKKDIIKSIDKSIILEKKNTAALNEKVIKLEKLFKEKFLDYESEVQTLKEEISMLKNQNILMQNMLDSVNNNNNYNNTEFKNIVNEFTDMKDRMLSLTDSIDDIKNNNKNKDLYQKDDAIIAQNDINFKDNLKMDNYNNLTIVRNESDQLQESSEVGDISNTEYICDKVFVNDTNNNNVEISTSNNVKSVLDIKEKGSELSPILNEGASVTFKEKLSSRSKSYKFNSVNSSYLLVYKIVDNEIRFGFDNKNGKLKFASTAWSTNKKTSHEGIIKDAVEKRFGNNVNKEVFSKGFNMRWSPFSDEQGKLFVIDLKHLRYIEKDLTFLSFKEIQSFMLEPGFNNCLPYIQSFMLNGKLLRYIKSRILNVSCSGNYKINDHHYQDPIKDQLNILQLQLEKLVKVVSVGNDSRRSNRNSMFYGDLKIEEVDNKKSGNSQALASCGNWRRSTYSKSPPFKLSQ